MRSTSERSRRSSLRETAKLVADRAVLAATNAIVYFGDNDKQPTMVSAPSQIVFERGKLRLLRLESRSDDEFELGHTVHAVEAPRIPTPVLIIPPLMVRPSVYDLRPEHSMLRTLRNAGFDVFTVDFGVPDREDEGVRLDDYVLDYVPTLVDATLRISGTSKLVLAGYCMGGLFSLLHVGTHDDDRVAALVAIGSPVNFSKMGVVTIAAHLGAPSIDSIIDVIGNVPGALSSFVFRLISGPRAFTRYLDLARNLHDEDYVRGFLAIDRWVNNMIPYPKEAFRQMFWDVVHENKLLRNELVFGDHPCDLGRIRCPLLAIAGATDAVAPPASTRGIVDLVSSEDKTFIEVPGGHVAVVAGLQAPQNVWAPVVAWLMDRLVHRTGTATQCACTVSVPPPPVAHTTTQTAGSSGARSDQGTRPRCRSLRRAAQSASGTPARTPR